MAAMMRQTRKQILTLALGLLCFATPQAVGAAPLVDTIVTDPLSGVALEGYDPVSYFTGGEPQPGKPDFEYDWGGVPWYFINAANRDVFSRHPEVYAPQYGGHCAMSLSRGYLSDGNPRLWVIERLKLYLFYSTANRAAFLDSPDAALVAAAANWPGLAGDLNGPRPGVAAPLAGNAAASPDGAGVSTGAAAH
jgi:YHS domain-containing protein